MCIDRPPSNKDGLSVEGNTIAVGATAEGSSGTGTNGDQSDEAAPFAGAAYLYLTQSNRA
jgi:hypothetical protein